MQVEILSATSSPIGVISLAAGTCYSKHDISFKRVESCYKAGHMSVFEHANATFRISGISRACSHQLVRHRVASYSQQSQRYCKVEFDTDWYVTPPWLLEGQNQMYLDGYRETMTAAAFNYLQGLKAGMKPEDARYMLPEATKTEIVVSMNLRELFHFFDTRMSKRAQWEIRLLAHEMRVALLYHTSEWMQLIEMYDKAER